MKVGTIDEVNNQKSEDVDVRDEATYKADLALTTVHKIREEVHGMRVDVSVMQQKSADHHEFMTKRMDSLAQSIQEIDSKVEGLMKDHIHKKGVADAFKIIVRYPLIWQTILIGMLVFTAPEFIKNHFLS